MLPPGVVCDACNNYFSRQVERPFLESEPIASMRFHEALPSKKGRIPHATAILAPDVPVSVERLAGGPITGIIEVDDPTVLAKIPHAGKWTVLFDAGLTAKPQVTSRFLAKVGLEAMAARLVAHPDGLAYLVDEAQLDTAGASAGRRATTLALGHAAYLPGFPGVVGWSQRAPPGSGNWTCW